MSPWDSTPTEKKNEESPTEKKPEAKPVESKPAEAAAEVKPIALFEDPGKPSEPPSHAEGVPPTESSGPVRKKLRGTAAMDPKTRQEVARKGGLAVSRNRQHMSEIGRKGGQSVSKNREHMAQIGKKGGESSRGSR